MRCTSPVRLHHLNRADYPDGLLVPCGKCLACRIARRSEWAMRMLHELESYSDAVFITLTYSEDYLPDRGSLSKDHLQKFFKRLRKELDKDGRRVRYFACGEYGDNYGRPHYHAILFGLSLREEDKRLVKWKWPYGIVHFGTAEPDSIRYVAQYIDKKFTGDDARREYAEKGREPVFRVSSLGLGKKYIEKHGEQIKKMGYCTVRGVMHSLPRYYLNKLGIDPILYRDMALQNESENYEKITGLNIDPNIAYRVRPSSEVTKYQKEVASQRKQKDINMKAKVNLKRKKF